jgi:hypothetical protein
MVNKPRKCRRCKKWRGREWTGLCDVCAAELQELCSAIMDYAQAQASDARSRRFGQLLGRKSRRAGDDGWGRRSG